MLIKRSAPIKAPAETTQQVTEPVKTLAKKKVLNTEAGAALAAKFIAQQLESEAMVTIHRYRDKIKNPKTAIRAKCVECSGGSLKEVAECPVIQCALHPFRMGVNPFNKKTKERLGLGVTDPDTEDEEGDDTDDE